MEHYNTYVGMDVHARSITCRGVNINTGESYDKKFNNCPTPADIALWLNMLPQPLYCAYESGCTGYYLARELRKLKIKCDIIAISTLAKSTKDKMNKCDKIDARVILKEISSPIKNYSIVGIPSEKIEAYRNFGRTVYRATQTIKKIKLNINSFLLQNGYVGNKKSINGNIKKRGTRDFGYGITNINFQEEGNTLTLKYYIEELKHAEQKLKELKDKIHEICQLEEVKPFIDAFLQIKGINEFSAFLALFEYGDFARFRVAKKSALLTWANTKKQFQWRID